jgi:hypothetical protein
MQSDTVESAQKPIDPPKAEPVAQPQKWQELVKIIAVSFLELARLTTAGIVDFWKSAQEAARERKRKQTLQSTTTNASIQPPPVAPSDALSVSGSEQSASVTKPFESKSWAGLKKKEKEQIAGCGCLAAIALVAAIIILPRIFSHSKEYLDGYARGKQIVNAEEMKSLSSQHMYIDVYHNYKREYETASRSYGENDPSVQELKGVTDGIRDRLIDLGASLP